MSLVIDTIVRCATRLADTIGTIVPLGYDGSAADGPTARRATPEPASRDLYHLLTTRDDSASAERAPAARALEIRDYNGENQRPEAPLASRDNYPSRGRAEKPHLRYRFAARMGSRHSRGSPSTARAGLSRGDEGRRGHFSFSPLGAATPRRGTHPTISICREEQRCSKRADLSS